MRILRYLTVGLLLIAAIIFSVAYAKKRQDNKVYLPQAHHVIYADWRVAKDGTRTLDNLRVREVSATGAWKEWVASLTKDQVKRGNIMDPTKSEGFKLPLEGSWGYRSAADFRAHKQFVREEMMAGYHCFTLRMEGSQSPDSWFELSFTPELGPTPLKFIAHLNGGGESVVEAIKVY